MKSNRNVVSCGIAYDIYASWIIMIVMYIFKYLNSIEDYLVNSIIVIFGYKPMQVKTERNRQPGTYIYRVQQILSLNMKTEINYTNATFMVEQKFLRHLPKQKLTWRYHHEKKACCTYNCRNVPIMYIHEGKLLYYRNYLLYHKTLP